jgi:NTP pyrophosphatase (non-canonical NTP hydrolase)
MDTSIADLIEKIREFRNARDWRQFHTLRNLITSVSIEAGELLELTQWKSEGEVGQIPHDPVQRKALEQESADVLIYLLLVADSVGFDLIEAAHHKLALNEKRYPVEKARGNATKYQNF